MLSMKCWRILDKSSIYSSKSFSMAQKMLAFSSLTGKILQLKISLMIVSDWPKLHLNPMKNLKMVLIELYLRYFRYLRYCQQRQYISSQSKQLCKLSLQKSNSSFPHDQPAILSFHLLRYSFIALTKLPELILNLKNFNSFISVSSKSIKLILLFLATVLVQSTFLSRAFEEIIMMLRAIVIKFSCQSMLTLKYLSIRLMTLMKVSLKKVNLTHQFLHQLNRQALFFSYLEGSGCLTFSSYVSSVVLVSVSLLGCSCSCSFSCLTPSCFNSWQFEC